MRPWIRDVIGSVLTLIAIVAVVGFIDQRVSGRVGGLASELSGGGWRAPVRALSQAVATVGGTPYMDNAYLAAFLVAGIVLVVLMLRT